MKKLALFILAASLAVAQSVNVQKTSGTNALTGSLVVGDGKTLTATGTGSIVATTSGNASSVSGNVTVGSGNTFTLNGTATGTPTGGTLSLANLTLTLPTSFATLTGTQTLTNKTLTAPVFGATPDADGALLFSAPSGIALSPWRMVHFLGSFDGQTDPIWAFGYNVANVTGRFNTSDSSVWYGLEADYYANFTGRGAGLQHYQEAYTRFMGSGGGLLTGFAITSDKANPFAYTVGSIAVAGVGSSFNFADATSGSEVTMMAISPNAGGATLSLPTGFLRINGDVNAAERTYRIHASEATAGTQNTVFINHTATSDAGSIARLQLQTKGGAGDPYVHWTVDTTTDVEYAAGIDNSDSDAFVFSRSSALGTKNVFRVVADAADTGSVTTFPGAFGIGTDPTAGRKMILGGAWAPTDGTAVGFEIANAITPPAGNAAIGLYVNPSFSEASSGTHSFMAGLYMAAPAVTNAAGTTTEASTLKIGGAPTGAGTTKYALRVDGGVTSSGDTTEATTGGAGSVTTAGGVYASKKIITASTFTSAAGATFDIGAANSVTPTSPNRTITIVINGTTYYLHAKTTND